jgi:hypothetical protein
MNDRTEGAWILSHANKLAQIENHDFEDIDMAGKAGKLLSGLVASHEESILSKEKVSAIAKIAGINKAELPTLLRILKSEELIDKSVNGEVVALGVTTTAVLGHTSKVFNSLNPSKSQKAAISLAESISAEPMLEKEVKEEISDLFKMKKKEIDDVFAQSEEIGFIDTERVDDEKLVFNGNLFKSSTLKKAKKILDTLNPTERKSLNNIDAEIKKNGVIPFDRAEKIAGRTLLEKVQSIGMYEFSRVSNSQENKLFITKPESFSKFGNPFEEDALDLAKSFVASLSYGINYSSSTRGRISLLYYLLKALIEGRTVGPAPAIGQDYRYLEIKRVVQIIPEGHSFSMRLLKKEVGELALQVMQQGDITDSALLTTSSNINSYVGPENLRRATRKKRQIKKGDAEVASLLRTLREE